MLCIFYLPVSEVNNKPSPTMGGVNKVFGKHDLRNLRIVLFYC